MCAKKLSSKEIPAGKVPLEEVLKDPGVDDEHAIRALRTSMSWGEWLRNDFLRYFYIVITLAVDTFVSLELGMIYNIHDLAGSIILIVLFVIGLIVTYIGYAMLWPEGILTSRSKES